MVRYNHLPLFKSAYTLTLDLYRLTHHFPREHKYALGQDIKQEATAFLLSIISANASREKTDAIASSEMIFERMSILLRLAYSLALVPKDATQLLRIKLQDIRTQLGGWKKWAHTEKVP